MNLKYGIVKAFDAGLSEAEELAAINGFARKALIADEVYIFPMILCDNEIDRDYERFSTDTLGELAKLFLGKTGIFDHNPKGANQTARIFWTRAQAEPNATTVDGEPLCRLYAKAYMLRSDKNADLIAEIDAGIKGEISVGCAVEKMLCSICGADRRSGGCGHRPGAVYDGKTCHHVLSGATDAYEWSFVAVPSQRGAGVIKNYKGESNMLLGEETQNSIKSLLDAGKAAVVEKSADGAYAVAEMLYAEMESTVDEQLAKAAAYGEKCKAALVADTLTVIQKSQGEGFNAEIWKSMLGKSEPDEIEEQRKAFTVNFSEDAVHGEAVEKAIAACVGAVGSAFDAENLRGVLKALPLAEVAEMCKCFDAVKKAALNAGEHLSKYTAQTPESTVQAGDYTL